MKNRRMRDYQLLFIIFCVFSFTLVLPTAYYPALAMMGPGGGGTPDGGGAPSGPGGGSPGGDGMMGPGGPAMGDMGGSPGSGMMGPGGEMMGPAGGSPGTGGMMPGGGMTGPSADSGWSQGTDGSWTPPAGWTPPVGWTPPAEWQSGQPISSNNVPWNTVGMGGTGQIPMMTMPTGGNGLQGLFGPGGPAIGDLQGVSGGMPGVGAPPQGMNGIFGDSGNIFNGGIMGMSGAPQGKQGPVIAITPPPENSGWTQGDDGRWTPPSDWTPPAAWSAPEGWQSGQPITLEQAPWNTLAAKSGKTESSAGGFIPGTLVKLPENMTLDQAMNNFDPTALGINLPSFMSASDFQKIMNGQVTVDSTTQDMIKALNPGKFGPMSDPYIMSRSSGLQMDEMGNFFVQASQGAPGNPFIVKAKELADQGKYGDALAALDDPNAPFNQFPDALIHTWKAELAANAGVVTNALQDIDKALALAPLEDKLYDKAGKYYQQAGQTEKPHVFVNGVKPDFDVEPFIQSGRTMVPFRSLAETMGAEVQYDGDARLVTMTKGGKDVKMTIGSNMATVNGNLVELDVPAQIVNGRTVIPLRFVSENLDSKVNYNSETKLVKILPVTP